MKRKEQTLSPFTFRILHSSLQKQQQKNTKMREGKKMFNEKSLFFLTKPNIET